MLDPRQEYSDRLSARLKTLSAKDLLHARIGNLKLVVVVAGILLVYLSLSRDLLRGYWVLVLGVVYLALAVLQELVMRARTRAATAADYYRRGIARIEDRWVGTGQSGGRFRVDEHVYAEDLDLFGKGSLFELLSTARLPMGENRLADWLCRPSPKPVVLARQQLVSEFRPKLDLRENLAVTGERLRPLLDPESLVGWAEDAPGLPGNVWRGVASALAVAAVATAVYSLLTSIAWPLLFVLLIEGIRFRDLDIIVGPGGGKGQP